MDINTVGFIGLGLIGGSIAKAIKNVHPSTCIIAYDTDINTLNQALSDEIADITTISINESFEKCDLIFLCAPDSNNTENLQALVPYLSSTAIVTDAGTLKAPIYEMVKNLKLDNQFIGGYPMSGREEIGYMHSNHIFLDGAYYIINTTAAVPRDAVNAYTSLITDMGATPLELDYLQHDYVVAAIGQIPQLVTAALAELVQKHADDDGIMKIIATGGFKNIMRIASSPETWESTFMLNAKKLSPLMDSYIATLQNITDAIKNNKHGHTYNLFKSSKEYRDLFLSKPMVIDKPVYKCYLEIPERSSIISDIAALLYKSDIAIKNIGINHFNTHIEDLLEIEFFEQQGLNEAMAILEVMNYCLYKNIE